jgi:hypothetical protein
MKKYYFGEGTPYDPKDAQAVGEFLERNFPGQDFKPKQIVELARPKNSPIHKFFDWDDRTAAAKYRIRQASRLVRSLYIKIEEQETKAYENVRFTATNKGYLNTESVLENKELWQQVVDVAKREILYWEAKYTLYKNQFPKIFSAIHELKKKEQTYGKEANRNGRGNKHSSDRKENSRDNNRRRHAAAGK